MDGEKGEKDDQCDRRSAVRLVLMHQILRCHCRSEDVYAGKEVQDVLVGMVYVGLMGAKTCQKAGR